MAAVRSPTERFFFFSSEDEPFVNRFDEHVTYVVFNDKRIEGLEERSECSAKGRREGGNEIPSRSDEHRVVFCGLFGCFLSFVLIRILLTDSLLFEDGGSQRANLVRFLKIMSVYEQDGDNETYSSQ